MLENIFKKYLQDSKKNYHICTRKKEVTKMQD
jgi:hypothetical protein